MFSSGMNAFHTSQCLATIWCHYMRMNGWFEFFASFFIIFKHQSARRLDCILKLLPRPIFIISIISLSLFLSLFLSLYLSLSLSLCLSLLPLSGALSERARICRALASRRPYLCSRSRRRFASFALCLAPRVCARRHSAHIVLLLVFFVVLVFFVSRRTRCTRFARQEQP